MTQLIFRKCNVIPAEAGGVGCAESAASLGPPRAPRTLRSRWRGPQAGAAGGGRRPLHRRLGEAHLDARAAAAALRQDGSIINKPERSRMDALCSALLCHPELWRNNKTVNNVFFFPLHLRPWHMSNCFFLMCSLCSYFWIFFLMTRCLFIFLSKTVSVGAGLLVIRQHLPCRVFKSFLK